MRRKTALKKATSAHLVKFHKTLLEIGTTRKRQKLKRGISGKKKSK
ncbi:hypothetical protein JXA05_02275 [Candidatus Peregrinibacteria bacterium]|nr:hypothetical protein [Candidatus Peregrinibacteria bacterium]